VRTAFVTVLLALALPAAAPAATISSNTNEFGGNRIEYRAGAGEANDVTALRVSEGIRVTDPGTPIQPSGECRSDGPDAAICSSAPGAGVGALVELGDGDDRLEWQLAGFATVHGGSGDDQVRVAGSVDGGTGADAIQAHSVDYSTRTAGVEVTLDGVANDGEPGEADNVKLGVRFIFGGSGADLISATGVGSDIGLIGNAGDDRLVGGAGGDGLFGGPGGDVLDGGAGGDRLDGGPGPDELHGGDAREADEVEGGAGSDRVTVGGGARMELRDGEPDEATCGVPGAIVLSVDPFDRTTGCNYSYLRFSPVARVYTSRDGQVHVRVGCVSSLRRPQCDGAVRLLLANTRTVLASGPFHLQQGRSDRVELKLRAAGRKLLRKRRRVSVQTVAAHHEPSDPPPPGLDTRDLEGRYATWVTRR
jgi:Ca2+-binding RTX toxin-like protein